MVGAKWLYRRVFNSSTFSSNQVLVTTVLFSSISFLILAIFAFSSGNMYSSFFVYLIRLKYAFFRSLDNDFRV